MQTSLRKGPGYHAGSAPRATVRAGSLLTAPLPTASRALDREGSAGREPGLLLNFPLDLKVQTHVASGIKGILGGKERNYPAVVVQGCIWGWPGSIRRWGSIGHLSWTETHGVDGEREASLSAFSVGLTVLLSHRILSELSITSLASILSLYFL